MIHGKAERRARSYRLSDDEYRQIKRILLETRYDLKCHYSFSGSPSPRKIRTFKVSEHENEMVRLLKKLWAIGASEGMIEKELNNLQ